MKENYRHNSLNKLLGDITNVETDWTIIGPLHSTRRSEIFKATNPDYPMPLRLKFSKSKKIPDTKLLVEFDCLNTFHNKFNNGNYNKTIRALSLASEINCLITEWEEGVSLDDYLSHWTNIAIPSLLQNKRNTYIFNSGHWLREFHLIGEIKNEVFDTNTILQDLDKRIRKVSNKDTQLLNNPVFLNAVDCLRQNARSLNGLSVESSIIHGDFAPRNILRNGNTTIGIDLANMSRQYCILDIGKFLIELHLHKHFSLWSNRSLFDDPDINSFLAGYRHDTEEVNERFIHYVSLYETIIKWISFNNKKSANFRNKSVPPKYRKVWFSYRCLQLETFAKRLLEFKPD